MEFRQLRAFLAVAEELHFGKAAQRLHIAQPAVSQLIRGLEAEVGVALFERTSRRVNLTAAGEVMVQEARDLIARYDQLDQRMARIRAGEIGEVGLGATPALPPDLLPRLLRELHLRLPDVAVVIRSLPSGLNAESALDRPDVDIALLRGEVSSPGITMVEFAREPVGVALPATNALATRSSLTAADLEGHALATFARHADPAEYDRIFGALRASGLQSYQVHESPAGGVDASLRLVRADIALSLKLQSEVRALHDDAVVWRPLREPTIEVLITAAWRPHQLGPAGRRVVSVLRHREVQ